MSSAVFTQDRARQIERAANQDAGLGGVLDDVPEGAVGIFRNLRVGMRLRECRTDLLSEAE